MGFALAKALENDYAIKLIEIDPQLAIRNGEALTKTIVLTGDATDRELLLSEDIEAIDVFCALTNHDEANIMSSLQAKYLGARNAMSLVNRDSFIELIDDSLIDAAISPQFITVTNILNTIKHDNVLKIHRLQENEAIAIEVLLVGNTKSSPLIGRPLVEVEWPQECIVVGLIRKKKLHFVTPNLHLANNDHLILIVWKRKYIHRVEAFFEVNLTFMS